MLPDFFKSIFWYCDYSKIDIEEDAEGVMIQTINYGDWQQWRWVFGYYGAKRVKNIIENKDVEKVSYIVEKIRTSILICCSDGYGKNGQRMESWRVASGGWNQSPSTTSMSLPWWIPSRERAITAFPRA